MDEIFLTQAFIKGFRYAALIMVEVYDGNKDSLPEIMKILNIGNSGK